MDMASSFYIGSLLQLGQTHLKVNLAEFCSGVTTVWTASLAKLFACHKVPMIECEDYNH